MLITHLNSYKKVYKTILSCKCKEHLDVANKLITCFYLKHNDKKLLSKLEIRYNLMKKIITRWY